MPTQTATQAMPASRRYLPSRARLRAIAPIAVLIGLCIVISLLNSNFLEWRNFVRIANTAAVPLTISVGLTFIILMGSIDLSVEGTLSVSAMLLVLLAANDSNANDWGWLAVLAAILAGTAIGLLNGLLHTFLRIPSFMTTLGVWFISLGVAVYALGGSAVRLLDSDIRVLALERVLGFPIGVWVALAMFALGCTIQYFTRIGRHILAVGGAEDIVEMSGIGLRRLRIIAFTLAGFFFAVAGVLSAAQLGQSNAVMAEGRLFVAVTAVVVGGTVLTGGEGGVLNTLIGVLIVVVLSNGMILLGISPYIQQAVQGALIIAAVILSLDSSKLSFVK